MLRNLDYNRCSGVGGEVYVRGLMLRYALVMRKGGEWCSNGV